MQSDYHKARCHWTFEKLLGVMLIKSTATNSQDLSMQNLTLSLFDTTTMTGSWNWSLSICKRLEEASNVIFGMENVGPISACGHVSWPQRLIIIMQKRANLLQTNAFLATTVAPPKMYCGPKTNPYCFCNNCAELRCIQNLYASWNLNKYATKSCQNCHNMITGYCTTFLGF